MHVVGPALNGAIYDLHIVFDQQTPPWSGGVPGTLPPGWNSQPVPGGIALRTETNPLLTCQPVFIDLLNVVPPSVNQIRIFATDQNHNIIGQFVSTKISGLAAGAEGDARWSAPPPCQSRSAPLRGD
ncbi:MAG: hypothetical protein IPO29_20600 [Anaerolineae bacterium]|nr:hypothetical protein [Anaerolineae bacterium]